MTDSSADLNVDTAEVAKFEALASRWWDPESEFRPLHEINPLRANFIDRISQVAGKQILDVGCGGGILTESLAHRGATVMGIDMGEAPLNVAKLHALETGLQNVSYQRTPVETLAEQMPEQFDVVCCMEMLEHVPDPQSVINACSKLVKPNGHVFFSTLNRNFKSYLFAIVGAEKLLKIVPEGTHEHEKFIRPAELIKMIDQTPLQELGITGLHYNPLTDTYRLGSNVDVNYIVHTQNFA